MFSYIKREMRDRERKKKERRDQIEEIKTEIRPSQLQMAITFNRKLRLRRATRPFSGPKNIVLTLKNVFEVFTSIFFCFFLRNCICFLIIE
jgi:hypothetical protein